MINEKKLANTYHPYQFASWYYLVKGKSTVVHAIDGVVVASKNASDIQVIADYLNNVQRLENELVQVRQVYRDSIKDDLPDDTREAYYTAYMAKITEVRQKKASFDAMVAKCTNE